MSIFSSKQERIRFLKFAFVGVTGTVVDFGIMNLMRLVFNVPLVWAQAISFTLAVFNNFLWNRYWTYPDSRSKAAHHQLIQFFLINLVGIAVRTPLIPWLNKLILNSLERFDFNLPLSNIVISQNLALAIVIAIVMLWNFFANRYWTYSDVPVEINRKEPEQVSQMSEKKEQ
jgi:putative flippase GtrA